MPVFTATTQPAIPQTSSERVVRILALADMVHPYIYRSGFPGGLPPIDLVLGAGDLPGYYLEFVASALPVPVLYVPGNHQDEYITEKVGAEHRRQPPGGATNIDGKVVEVAGLRIAGWGGVPKYREGENQYTDAQGYWGLKKLAWRARRSGPIDIFLTHAPPLGPHALSDFPHRGCRFISGFVRSQCPSFLLHGHIHEYEGKKPPYVDPITQTEVVNVYGYQLIEYPLSAQAILRSQAAGHLRHSI